MQAFPHIPEPTRRGLAGQLDGPRSLMEDAGLIDIRMGVDIGAVFAVASVVYATDLIRLGWTPAQVEAFQTRWTKGGAS